MIVLPLSAYYICMNYNITKLYFAKVLWTFKHSMLPLLQYQKNNLSSISNTKMQNNLQLRDITPEAHQSPDQKSSRIDYTSIQQNTSAAHWSFLNDCEINKIITHLSGMKLNDLKALYDTVSLKLTKQNGYIVDYNSHLF